MNNDLGKLGIFLCGVLFGTAGITVLSSKDAKKAYVHCTAAALRAKDYTSDKVTVLQENCEDILAEAKKLNEERAAKEAAEEFEDLAEEAAEAAAE